MRGAARRPGSKTVTECLARAKRGLRYPTRLPWTRSLVDDALADAHRAHLARELQWVTRVAPDRHRRDEAVRASCAVTTIPVAVEAGAFDLAAGCPGYLKSDAFEAVAIERDADAMVRIASMGGDDPHIRDAEHAAALCLSGHRQEAARLC